jgi:hypothetical protein
MRLLIRPGAQIDALVRVARFDHLHAPDISPYRKASPLLRDWSPVSI